VVIPSTYINRSKEIQNISKFIKGKEKHKRKLIDERATKRESPEDGEMRTWR
jgi:hypothetical protein